MKKFLRMSALALFVCFASCSDDDSNPTTSAGEATMTAKINGENWTGTVTSATLLKVSTMGEQRFDVTAEGAGKRIIVTASSAIQAGMPLQTYTFDDEGATNALFTNSYLIGNNSSMTVHFPESGQVTISSFDTANKKASGTFQFTNYRVATIEGMDIPEDFVVTEGQFSNVTYTEHAQ